MCIIFHKWEKWQRYKKSYAWTPGIIAPKSIQGNVYEGVEYRQHRKCLKCGKHQDKLIYDDK